MISPDDFRVLGSRIFNGAAALNEGVALEVGLEDEDEVSGRDDAAAALGRHLVRDQHLVVDPLKYKGKGFYFKK